MNYGELQIDVVSFRTMSISGIKKETFVSLSVGTRDMRSRTIRHMYNVVRNYFGWRRRLMAIYCGHHPRAGSSVCTKTGIIAESSFEVGRRNGVRESFWTENLHSKSSIIWSLWVSNIDIFVESLCEKIKFRKTAPVHDFPKKTGHAWPLLSRHIETGILPPHRVEKQLSPSFAAGTIRRRIASTGRALLLLVEDVVRSLIIFLKSKGWVEAF